MNTLVIMTGVPGSGKSTLAARILASMEDKGLEARIFSTDNYWVRPDGTYDFNPSLLGKAHAWNKDQYDSGVPDYDAIIIDNTNLVESEVTFYVEKALEHYKNVKVIIAESNLPWRHDAKECAKRNSHNVPLATINKMLERKQSPLVIANALKAKFKNLNISILGDVYIDKLNEDYNYVEKEDINQ